MPSLHSVLREPMEFNNFNCYLTSPLLQLGSKTVGLFFCIAFFSSSVAIAQVENAQELEAALTADNLSVDELGDSFYEQLVEKANDDRAGQIAESMHQIGLRNQNKDLQARGLVRIANVELFIGKWRNNGAMKIEKCERLLGNMPAVHSVAKAEFLMFTGHMSGKWQNDQAGGFQQIEELIWVGNISLTIRVGGGRTSWQCCHLTSRREQLER